MFPFCNFTVDHVVPQSRGGTDHLENLQLAQRRPAAGVPRGEAGGDGGVESMEIDCPKSESLGKVACGCGMFALLSANKYREISREQRKRVRKDDFLKHAELGRLACYLDVYDIQEAVLFAGGDRGDMWGGMMSCSVPAMWQIHRAHPWPLAFRLGRGERQEVATTHGHYHYGRRHCDGIGDVHLGRANSADQVASGTPSNEVREK